MNPATGEVVQVHVRDPRGPRPAIDARDEQLRFIQIAQARDRNRPARLWNARRGRIRTISPGIALDELLQRAIARFGAAKLNRPADAAQMRGETAIPPAEIFFVLNVVDVVHQPPSLHAVGPRQRADTKRDVIEEVLARLAAKRVATAGTRFKPGHAQSLQRPTGHATLN